MKTLKYIAERSARNSSKDLNRFLEIAKESCLEMETQLIIANKLAGLSESELDELIGAVQEIQKMITGLQKNITTYK